MAKHVVHNGTHVFRVDVVATTQPGVFNNTFALLAAGSAALPFLLRIMAVSFAARGESDKPST